MRLFIIGGTGFCGRHVVWRALQSGHAVMFTGRDHVAAESVIRLAPTGCGGPFPEFRPVAAGIPPESEAVIDCAGLTALGAPPRAYQEANVTRVSAALEAAAAVGVRTFVSVSSASVLFRCHDQIAMPDGIPVDNPGIHPYADSKAECERMLWSRRGRGVTIRILRPRGIYGPFDSGVLPRLTRAARRFGGRLPLPAPEALASMTAASNLAHAVLLAAETDHEQGDGVWNVSDGDDRTLGELIARAAAALGTPLVPVRVPRAALLAVGLMGDKLAALSGREPVISRYTAELMCRTRTLSIEAIRRDLGYRPLLTVDEAFAGLAAFAATGALTEYSRVRYPSGKT